MNNQNLLTTKTNQYNNLSESISILASNIETLNDKKSNALNLQKK